MDSATARSLLTLNRQFYTDHGRDFSATRKRLQPGVVKMLDRLNGREAILDVGCGNGELARTLSHHGHKGSYLGLDFSLPLLKEAGREPFAFPVKFQQADLTALTTEDIGLQASSFDLVFTFAVLHHIPTIQLRIGILQNMRELLKPDGHFIHSNWQFLNNPRLRSRIQPWIALGLTEQDVDTHDYLLDWKRGGLGYRYVHHFDELELAGLAKTSGFKIAETFYSDGEDRKSSLYQVWEKA